VAPEGESKLSKEFLEECACIDKNARNAEKSKSAELKRKYAETPKKQR
jgi:hypothetical protein